VSIGFTGIISSLKGAKGAVREVHERESHVGSDEHAVHALLAQVGPDAALVLVCCDDQETRDTVVARTADRASESWDGSRAQFLAGLDPGSQHDWLRAAVREPS
jgi:predicted N-acetyltransferase YhbS